MHGVFAMKNSDGRHRGKKMSEEIVGQLAALPPNQWAQFLKRFSVVDRYLRLLSPTSDDVDRSAAELMIGPRSFFRLAAAARQFRAGISPPPSQKGFHSHLHPRTQYVIEEVRLELGPAARDTEILAECRKRCGEIDIPAPSMSAIRTRTGKRPAIVDLAGRLRREADLVLDSSTLDLVVSGHQGQIATAALTTLIHMESAQTLGFHVGAGVPDVSDVAMTVLHALSPEMREGTAPARTLELLITGNLHKLQPVIDQFMGTGRMSVDVEQSQGLRPAAAITASLGRRIGRIPIAPRRRSKPDPKLAVPLEYAQTVVAELFRRRSQLLEPGSQIYLADVLGPRRTRTLRHAALQLLKESN